MKREARIILATLLVCGLILGALFSEWLCLAFVMWVILAPKAASFIVAGVSIGCILIAIRIAKRRAWGRLCATILISAAALTSALAPFQVGREVLEIVRPIHFALMLPFYEMQIRALPTSEPRIQEFNWGGMLFASYGVLYDETDEIGAPAQSQKWLVRMHNTDITCGSDAPVADVRHMIGHYYLTGFGC